MHLSGGTSTSTKMSFRCKLLYSSIIASTHPSASLWAMASWYECSASVVRNSAMWSVLSTGELLVPTEGAPCDGIGPVSVVLGLDPKDNFRSLSGCGGGMPLFRRLDLRGGMDVGMVSDGELSSGAGKSFP